MFDSIHFHSHERPGACDIKLLIRELREHFMSQLSDAIDTLKASDAKLLEEVNELIGAVMNIPVLVNDAVAKALADAGVDDAAATATLGTLNADVQAGIDAAVTALGHAPGAPVGGDTVEAPADTGLFGGTAGSDTTAG